MAERARFFEGKKYMWDGQEYENEEQASPVEKQYTERASRFRCGAKMVKCLFTHDALSLRLY